MSDLIAALEDLTRDGKVWHEAISILDALQACGKQACSIPALGKPSTWGFNTTAWNNGLAVIREKRKGKNGHPTWHYALRLMAIDDKDSSDTSIVNHPLFEPVCNELFEGVVDLDINQNDHKEYNEQMSLADFVAEAMSPSATAVIDRIAEGDMPIPKTFRKKSEQVTEPQSMITAVAESVRMSLLSFSDDDEIQEDYGSSEDLSGDVEVRKLPSWLIPFAKLNQKNPLLARLSAIKCCYWHPSFNFDQQRWLLDRVNRAILLSGHSNMTNDQIEELERIQDELALIELDPDADGTFIVAMLSVVAPRPLLKNPNAVFNEEQGTYSFKDGERPSKFPLTIGTGLPGSGKSELLKMLGLLCDRTETLGSKPMSVAQAISEIKDRRLGNEGYKTGWRKLPVENYDEKHQVFSNPLFLIADLNKKGNDHEGLMEALKASCEMDKPITRQSGSLDGNNKSWMVSGANIAITSTYPITNDDSDLLAEITRRACIIQCKSIDKSDKGRKIKPFLIRPESLDWAKFSLSFVWQEELVKLKTGNWQCKFVVTKDSKLGNPENGFLVYHLQRALAQVSEWPSIYGFNASRFDFLASIAAYGLVAFVNRRKWLSKEQLVQCFKIYFADLEAAMATNSNTSSEFRRQFAAILESTTQAKLKEKGQDYYKKHGLEESFVEIIYNNCVKRLKPRGAERIGLIELMASLLWEAKTHDENGKLYVHYSNPDQYECRFFPVEEEPSES